MENNEEVKKDDDDEDNEMSDVIKQMKDLLQSCKVSLDDKDEIDQEKLA